MSAVRYCDYILGAFTELRKSTISFVMSVCSSVCRHGTTLLLLDGFSHNFILEYFFQKAVKKIQV